MYWGWRRRPRYGEIMLLMKNRDRMLRIMSSYSGSSQSITKRKNGNNVVFKKNAAQFLYNFIEIYPVSVYLPYQPVKNYIKNVSTSLTTSISTAKTIDISASPIALLSY
jgi:hypothetical protein